MPCQPTVMNMPRWYIRLPCVPEYLPSARLCSLVELQVPAAVSPYAMSAPHQHTPQQSASPHSFPPHVSIYFLLRGLMQFHRGGGFRRVTMSFNLIRPNIASTLVRGLPIIKYCSRQIVSPRIAHDQPTPLACFLSQTQVLGQSPVL